MYKPGTLSLSNRVTIVIITASLVLALLTVSIHLADPYLWFDEAGQFFISHGLNHYSDPLVQENGLSDVVKNNALYNLDPGGFSLLLHFWSKLSNSHIWLRLLPFSFFIGTVLAFIYLAYLGLEDLRLALLIGFIPIVMPALRTAIEIRAYSMETLGSLICIIAFVQLKNNISIKHLFLWSVVLSGFITSRYSVIVVAFVISLYVFHLIFISDFSTKRRVIAILTYSTPLFSTLVYIYFYSFNFQNRGLRSFGYLPYIGTDLTKIFSPFTSFLYLLFLLLLLLLCFYKDRIKFVMKHQKLLHIVVLTNLLFMGLSVLGVYPWSPFFRRNNSFVSITLLCLAVLLAELLLRAIRQPKTINYLLLTSLPIIALGIGFNHTNLSRYQINTYSDLLTVDFDDYDRIYVDWWESASIRYLFEYGAFRSRADVGYPERFTFGDGISNVDFRDEDRRYEFIKTQPVMNEMVEYDLLIAPKLSEYGPTDKWRLVDGTTTLYIKSGS
ncbi:MAG: hypothetical protein V2I67_05830 [Thermoanaerobaculales bacterium]|jgi:hypothetical protein|nr:hypothetical protein [Thermoanaerobaculales bacterium]